MGLKSDKPWNQVRPTFLARADRPPIRRSAIQCSFMSGPISVRKVAGANENVENVLDRLRWLYLQPAGIPADKCALALTFTRPRNSS